MVDPKDGAPEPARPVAPMTKTGAAQAPAANGGKPDIQRDAKLAADTAKNTIDDLGEQAKQAASDAATDAKEEVRSFAKGQKDQAAGQVGGVADALRSAAGNLDDQNQSAVADYARQAASGLDQVSDALSNRSVDDLVTTVEDFARRQPVAFLGGTVLAGFVLARFAKSSAERRSATTGNYAGAPPYRNTDPDARQPLRTGGHAVTGHASAVTRQADRENH